MTTSESIETPASGAFKATLHVDIETRSSLGFLFPIVEDNDFATIEITGPNSAGGYRLAITVDTLDARRAIGFYSDVLTALRQQQ